MLKNHSDVTPLSINLKQDPGNTGNDVTVVWVSQILFKQL